MINWLKKNWIIGLLFIFVVFILTIKYKTYNSVNKESNIKIIPTVIVNNKITIIPDKNEKIIGGLNTDQINNLKMEEYELFVDGLNEEEYNSLPPIKYPIEEYLDYENNIFKILSYGDNQLKVKSKIEDKIKSENELNIWLKSFIEPINFNISWE